MRKIDLFLLLKDRHRKRLSRKNGVTRVLKSTGKVLILLLSIASISIIIFMAYVFARITYNLPSLEELPVLINPQNGELLQPSRITDKSGEVTLFTYENPGIQRRFLSVDPQAETHFSPQVIRAVAAQLDPSFWENPGYNRERWKDPEPHTIAEHLVNDLLLWNEPASTLRPLRMRLLASQIISKYGRTQVLEWYLNSAYFGHLAYGAESAAQLYLQKSAQDLTLAEAALLTPLIESPALNPIDAPESALAIQRDFLKALLASGQINQEEYVQAAAQKLVLRKAIDAPESTAPGFAALVEKQAGKVISIDRIKRGGVLVTTTLDADLQAQLACTTTTQLIRIQQTGISGISQETGECKAALLLPTRSFEYRETSNLAAAGTILDPSSGNVLAYLSPVSLTGQTLPDAGYESGSMLSPFAALAGFARGYSPGSLMWDTPVNLPADITSAGIPINAFHGPVNLRESLANDYVNPITALTLQVGVENVWKLAIASGWSSLSETYGKLAEFYEGNGTNLLDMTAAYGTLANSGVRTGALDAVTQEIQPNTLVEIRTTSGEVLYSQPSAASSTVLSEQLAYLINNVLSDETARWPSLGYPNALEIGSPVAVKAGATANHNQVWTVGYTPDLLVLTWMGTNGESDPAPLDVNMPAGVWSAVFRYANQAHSFTGWTMPAGVNQVLVCSPSGMLPTADCPTITSDVFLDGNEPTLPDTLYVKIKINRETGQRATVFTSLELVEERIYINVPENAREWAQQAGLPVPPEGYDTIQSARTDPDVSITSPALFAFISGKVRVIGTASGANFGSYTIQVGEGINPETWQQIDVSGVSPVMNGTLAEWDTNGLNGLYAIKLNVIDSARQLKRAVTQVTVDNLPPLAKLSYPMDGQTVHPVQGGVTLISDVQDEVGIKQVEWWIDGKKAATQITQPFVYLLQSISGEHTAKVIVTDRAGNQTSSDQVKFRIEQ